MIREIEKKCNKKLPKDFLMPESVKIVEEDEKYFISGIWDLKNDNIPDNLEDLTFKFPIRLSKKIEDKFSIELLNDYRNIEVKEKFIKVNFEENKMYNIEVLSYITNQIKEWDNINKMIEKNAPSNISNEGIYYLEFRHNNRNEKYNTSDSDIFYYTKEPHIIYRDYDSLEEYLEGRNKEKSEMYSQHFHIFGNKDLDNLIENYYTKNYSKFIKEKNKSQIDLRKTVIEADERGINENVSSDKIIFEIGVVREI